MAGLSWKIICSAINSSLLFWKVLSLRKLKAWCNDHFSLLSHLKVAGIISFHLKYLNVYFLRIKILAEVPLSRGSSLGLGPQRSMPSEPGPTLSSLCWVFCPSDIDPIILWALPLFLAQAVQLNFDKCVHLCNPNSS